jgi:hypothetical protein
MMDHETSTSVYRPCEKIQSWRRFHLRFDRSASEAHFEESWVRERVGICFVIFEARIPG